MAEAEAEAAKWELHFQKEVKGITADKVWPLFEDFCSIHKLFPNYITDSWALEGEYGKPGLTRYCIATAAFLPPSAVHRPDNVVYYGKEVLLKCDPIERCLIYQVVENNMGINDYVATVRVDPVTGGSGCCIQWSVVADPMDGLTFDDFKSGWSSSFEEKVRSVVALLSPGTA